MKTPQPSKCCECEKPKPSFSSMGLAVRNCEYCDLPICHTEPLTPSETEVLKMFDEQFDVNYTPDGSQYFKGGIPPWPRKVKSFLLTQLRLARAETEKAFGGCTSCYGKGYATQRETAGTSRSEWVLFPYVPCKHCNRGEQVQKLIEVTRADERKQAYEDGKNAACERIRTAFLSMEPWIPKDSNTAWLPRNVVEIAIESARKA